MTSTAATHAALAAAAAIANAIKASGTLVHVETEAFHTILAKMKAPLVVMAEGGVFAKKYLYLVSYKGLAFHTKSATPLYLPSDTELIQAKKIWMPD
ncbi:MAG: hypothetical protein DKINENOH_02057 [bacterium]|nr:hypothetical protein [bacterium]MCK6558295.1 hypothetical protein [bacterium]NUM64352.1 hypothetical protein [candidate division KSB1 bacterium]